MEEGDIWLERYDGQNLDELIKLQTTHRVDSLVLTIESVLDERKDSGIKMSEEELVILAVESFERQVDNGGFCQFFYNSSVEYAPIIVSSLQKIGCNEVAALMTKAIELLDVEFLDRDVILERINSFDEELENALGELDDVYFNETNDIPTYALFGYIKNNRECINLK